MSHLASLMIVAFKGALRDRLLHAVLGVALLLVLLVPVLSVFSLRQVQELAITLSLSAVSVILVAVATILGASSVWRDIERRYTTSVLALPFTRSTYLLGRFCGIALFLVICALLLGGAALVVVWLAANRYPSDTPVQWATLLLSLSFDCLKAILLAGVGMFFSCVSTSFSLPFFSTLAVYFCGSASQEVYEYVTGEFGQAIAPVSRLAIKTVYYLVPNLSAFNLKVQATYGLPLPDEGLLLTILYFAVYLTILLVAAAWSFSRRELT